MKVTRKFTSAGSDPFASVKWAKRSSKITNPDGSTVFRMDDAEVPETWSQLATDIMVSKYFRKAGVPIQDESGVPVVDSDGSPVLGPERSARQVIHRLAGCWRHWGEQHEYFDTPADAQAFYDELAYMLVHQMAAPNSPQWFNTGLNWAYGITGPSQGHYVPDPITGKVGLAKDAYTHPQPHACFIQSVDDDLVNDGGIMDLWVREARLFKYGSGTGTNFSRLRAENESLAGGGKSSGLMSWLKIGDRAAGAIKSGGTTRRAAKMVCLDMDHPDIATFINWKVREEIKVAALVEGLKHLGKDQQETAKKLGLKLDYDFNGEAYSTVSGQNSNNSIRIPDEFFAALDADAEWKTWFRTTGQPAKAFQARELWDQVGFAAWRCADPGVQFDSTINAWHTCPAGGRINASNPCSEYMFLDNTACNLASINVLKFYDKDARTFDTQGYEHAIDLWTIVLEISVLMASYPSSEVARLSFKYRTLGLGYANLGAMLMQAGIPYDSEAARAVCACLTSILTGRAYRQSAVMAAQLGPFAGYVGDREAMLRVIRNHRLAAHGVPRTPASFDSLTIPPVPIDHDVMHGGPARGVHIANADELLDHSTRAWDEALNAGEKHGFRNAQVTVIAPTGTIGLLMDCDTTGIEPDFALVKFKKLAGGGYFKIANDSVEPALHALGYSPEQLRGIMDYLLGRLTLDVPMPATDIGTSGQSAQANGHAAHAPAAGTFREFLLAKGLSPEDLARVEAALPGVFELGFAFNAWTLGDDALTRLGLYPERVKADPKFNLLAHLGLDRAATSALNDAICGTQTVEGAPHLRPEHLPIFDCANTCGKYGRRFIAAEGHIRMMAAAQPFISGAISKTINLPNSATVEDIKASYRLSWELGLKANALYRDGCKLSQPLSSTSDSDKDADKEAQKRKSTPPVVAEPTRTPVLAARVPAQQERVVERVIERVVERPMRRRLPDTRASITHKFNIAGHEGYLTVGLYEDGMPGELFITMAKEGSTIGGLMDSLGTAVSVALQYGVPIEGLVNKFTHQRFEPAGMTANRDIPIAKSLVDYIFRWMGMEFIPGYHEANAPKRTEPGEIKSSFSENSDDLNVSSAVNRFRQTAGPDRVESTPAADRPAMTPGLEDEQPWNDFAEPETSDAPVPATTRSPQPARPTRGPTSGDGQGMTAPRGTAAHGSGTASAAPAGRSRNGSSASMPAQSMAGLNASMRNNQEDAPACDSCGAITVRSGTCYKCVNCGSSMGCS